LDVKIKLDANVDVGPVESLSLVLRQQKLFSEKATWKDVAEQQEVVYHQVKDYLQYLAWHITFLLSSPLGLMYIDETRDALITLVEAQLETNKLILEGKDPAELLEKYLAQKERAKKRAQKKQP
jgi:hypothetical protein